MLPLLFLLLFRFDKSIKVAKFNAVIAVTKLSTCTLNLELCAPRVLSHYISDTFI